MGPSPFLIPLASVSNMRFTTHMTKPAPFASVSDLTLSQDQSTNNQHLAYTVDGNLKAVCNARFEVYSAHDAYGVSQASWNRCDRCDARAVRLTGDAHAYDRVIEDAAYVAAISEPATITGDLSL